AAGEISIFLNVCLIQPRCQLACVPFIAAVNFTYGVAGVIKCRSKVPRQVTGTNERDVSYFIFHHSPLKMPCTIRVLPEVSFTIVTSVNRYARNKFATASPGRTLISTATLPPGLSARRACDNIGR